MREIWLAWVVVSTLTEKVTLGSFTEEWRAEEYARAFRELRGIECQVVHREEHRWLLPRNGGDR